MKPTVDQVRAEPAGHQADMWVLEYIFGCKLTPIGPYQSHRVWLNKKGRGIYFEGEEPRFSTDPVAFHRMLTEMRQGWDWCFEFMGGAYFAHFGKVGQKTFMGHGSTVMEAGVRAALLAVMEEKK